MNVLQQIVRRFNPWHGGEGTYVYRERERLKKVENLLSSIRPQRVRTRFNPDSGCAELYLGRKVFATIKIFGEMCNANRAIIITHGLSWPEITDVRALFEPMTVKVFPHRFL